MKIFLKTITILISLTFIVVACMSHKTTDSKNAYTRPRTKQTGRQPADYSDINQIINNRANDDLQFNQLVRAATKTQNINSTLAEVKKLNPTYMTHYVLAYESLSLQEGSYINPRAIVFGKTAKFVMTFQGSDKQRGYGTLETMEHDPDRGFLFREIAFLNDGSNTIPIKDRDMSLSSDHVHVSKPNIGRCTACHGEKNTRPIWENYFL